MVVCIYCNKPIVLSSSAKERAAKYGGVPSDYTRLFSSHSECFIAERSKQASDLIKRTTAIKVNTT